MSIQSFEEYLEATQELRELIRQELIDEIREELEDAIRGATADTAPEIGTEQSWGKDEAKGLQSFLDLFDKSW